MTPLRKNALITVILTVAKPESRYRKPKSHSLDIMVSSYSTGPMNIFCMAYFRAAPSKRNQYFGSKLPALPRRLVSEGNINEVNNGPSFSAWLLSG